MHTHKRELALSHAKPQVTVRTAVQICKDSRLAAEACMIVYLLSQQRLLGQHLRGHALVISDHNESCICLDSRPCPGSLSGPLRVAIRARVAAGPWSKQHPAPEACGVIGESAKL